MPEPTSTAPAAVLTIQETARLLRISRQSAYQAVRTGELPTVKIGRRILVPRHRLEAMLGDTSDDPAVNRVDRKDASDGSHDPLYT